MRGQLLRGLGRGLGSGCRGGGLCGGRAYFWVLWVEVARGDVGFAGGGWVRGFEK